MDPGTNFSFWRIWILKSVQKYLNNFSIALIAQNLGVMHDLL